jgi:heterodisulfide reductase subunit A
VVHAEESLFICSTEAAAMLAKDIEGGVSTGSSLRLHPRTHERLFRDTWRGRINQYYSIWQHQGTLLLVHSKEKEGGHPEGKGHHQDVRGRSCHLEPLQEFDLPVDKRALVVGGGISGMTSALSIAKQGHEVWLVEKEKELGGMVRKLHYTLEGLDVQAFLKDLVAKVYSHPMIHVYTGATIPEATGYVGNFQTKIESNRGTIEIKHGATVIAIGADLYTPTEYLYGENERVMNHWSWRKGSPRVTKRSSVRRARS